MCKQRGFVALILAVTIMAVMIVMVDMALPAQAEVTAAKLSQSELADIERVEHALNQIKTLQALSLIHI